MHHCIGTRSSKWFSVANRFPHYRLRKRLLMDVHVVQPERLRVMSSPTETLDIDSLGKGALLYEKGVPANK
jgi:hypothetical protein